MSETGKTRKTQQGSVISNAMDKGIVVLVERKVRHKQYGKYIRRRAKYMAHDAANECNVGDIVLIDRRSRYSYWPARVTAWTATRNTFLLRPR